MKQDRPVLSTVAGGLSLEATARRTGEEEGRETRDDGRREEEKRGRERKEGVERPFFFHPPADAAGMAS